MMNSFLVVVAGALRHEDGRWLMHRRPPGKHHAGLWEFPGGKVEDHELPGESLVRELSEELGILVDEQNCQPACFAESAKDEAGRAIVILLYTVREWLGEPQALEGGDIDWFTPADIAALPKPPLDVRLAEHLFRIF